MEGSSQKAKESQTNNTFSIEEGSSEKIKEELEKKNSKKQCR